MGLEYHQLFEDLLQMPKDLEHNLVGGFGGGRRTGTLVGMVEDINYINDKGKMPWKHSTPDRLFQLHIDVMKFGLEEAQDHVDQLEAMAEKFGSFRAPNLKYHPFHRYEIVLYDIAEKLRDTIEYVCLTAQLCIEKYFELCEVRENEQVHLPDQMINGAVVLSSQILRICEISKSLRNLIVIPQVHRKQLYSKTQAVEVVTAHRKGTSERAAAYSFLVKNECVPSERALRTEVDKFDRGTIVIEEEWNVKKGRKKHHKKVRIWRSMAKFFQQQDSTDVF